MILGKDSLTYLYNEYRRRAKHNNKAGLITRKDFTKMMEMTRNTEEGLQQIDYFLALLSVEV